MRLLGHWNWWVPARLRRLPVLGTALLVVALPLLSACGASPILANAPAPHPTTPAPSPLPSRPSDPAPISLPADDRPHDRLTEWWYYTGHLTATGGRRLDFEYVIFRAERGALPVSWASHLAVTDRASGRFHYAQRTSIGGTVDTSTMAGFRLALPDPAGQAAAWQMAGSGGRDTLAAAAGTDASSTGTPFALELRTDPLKPAALHDTDGWIDFGPAGGSYYYSRTALRVDGTVMIGGQRLGVRGQAWFDHQWGDFIAVGGGGWDWFAVNLDDGTDVTLSLVRNSDGSYPLVYGTLVDADGTTRHLARDEFTVAVSGSWASPTTGAEYPAAWRIDIPAERLKIELKPTVADQELDTRASSGVVYWEGSQVVTTTHAGKAVNGEAYVELTGYAPTAPASADPSAPPIITP
jgi:predicted secreted hydrolase